MARKITVYDELGRARRIDAEDWADHVLPQLLEDVWDDSDQLAARILSAVGDGFPERVLTAAERLGEIDDRSDRAASVLAFVRSQLGEIDTAEGILLEFLRDHGDSGLVLAQLGQLELDRDDATQAEAMFRRALHVDPNQVYALERWLELIEERGGTDAWRAAVGELSAIDGAFWPQLLAARRALQDELFHEAESLYDEVWGRVVEDSSALLRVSGDLGAAGLPGRLVTRVAKDYDPEEHGVLVGINLLRAYAELGRVPEGRRLLDRVRRIEAPHLAQELAAVEAELAAAAREAALPSNGPIKVSVVPFEGPTWAACFAETGPLVPRPVRASCRIALLSLSDVRAAQRGHELGEDEIIASGRISRGLPLYLAEALTQATDASATALVPVIREAGPILAGEPWDPDWFLQEIPPDVMPHVLVRGQVAMHGIELELIETESGKTFAELTFPCDDDLQPSLIAVENSVRDALERGGYARPRRRPAEVFESVPPGPQKLYLRALDHLHAQILLASDLVEPEAVFNDTAAMQAYFDLAEAMPENRSAVLIATGGVLAAHGYGSGVVRRFKEPLLELLRRDGPDGVLAQLADYVEERL